MQPPCRARTSVARARNGFKGIENRGMRDLPFCCKTARCPALPVWVCHGGSPSSAGVPMVTDRSPLNGDFSSMSRSSGRADGMSSGPLAA